MSRLVLAVGSDKVLVLLLLAAGDVFGRGGLGQSSLGHAGGATSRDLDGV